MDFNGLKSHRHKPSVDTTFNLEILEEQNIMDLKYRLDEEVVKNEHLERKIRSLEFSHLKQMHELKQRI